MVCEMPTAQYWQEYQRDRQGKARQGEARRGEARHGKPRARVEAKKPPICDDDGAFARSNRFSGFPLSFPQRFTRDCS